MVGAFPPPMHGMAAVNGAVRTQLERMSVPIEEINIAAPSLDRSLTARLARLPKVLFLLLARLHGMRIFLHHHSYAYLDQRKALLRILVYVAGSAATHIALSD